MALRLPLRHPRPLALAWPRGLVCPSGIATCLLACALIIGGGAARLAFRQWPWRAGNSGTRLFDGVPIHWEWLDVANSAWFLEGDPRWTAGHFSLRSDQVIRFLPAVAIEIVGSWTRDALSASALILWLCWAVAAAATYGLCRTLIPQPGRGHAVGCIAALLVALSPGFTAYVGTIEARPYAYAAAAAALLALETARRVRLAPPAGGAARDARAHPVVLAALIFLANGTLELGPPLLAMLWLMYVVVDGGAGTPPLRARAGWAAQITAGFVAMDAGWRLLAWLGTLGRVTTSVDNDGLYQVRAVLAQAAVDGSVLTARLWGVLAISPAAFTPIVVAAVLPGLLLLPPRAVRWTAAWIGVVVVTIVLTRYWPRTLHLAFPAVYIAAAAAAERAGRVLATWVPGWLGGRTATVRAALAWAPAAVLLYLAGRFVFADLGGDVTLARIWWPA